MTRIQAAVIDANHRPRGTMPIHVEFHDGTPCRVAHDGQDYSFRRHGTHLATGRATVELATVHDARIWVTLDGREVWED